MPEQGSQVCLSFFMVLLLLANYGISAQPSDKKSHAPPASESANKSSVPDVKTKSDKTLSQGDQKNLSQELASPSSVHDPNLETKGDENVSTSLSPSNVDNSVLDTRDMDNLPQKNTSLPPSKAGPPAVGTKDSSTEGLFQENTSVPPPSVEAPAVATKEDENVSQQQTKGNEVLARENTYVPSSSPIMDSPGVEENKSSALAPAYIDTPALETSDRGSFTQGNQSSVTYVNNATAPVAAQDYSSATPPNTETQNVENVPELNNHSSLPKTAVPSPSKAVSFPEPDPTIQMTPSNEGSTFGLAPTSDHPTILPFNYRAEDEPVEPYGDEEDSWNGMNGAVAGALVSACVVGVGGFVYQKRKKDNIRAQYHCLDKKEGV
ncbi:hypothetical protein DITRI_Ditri12bG0153200 [Diplodiscus trichospermus]